jgi:hypothetical protein
MQTNNPISRRKIRFGRTESTCVAWETIRRVFVDDPPLRGQSTLGNRGSAGLRRDPAPFLGRPMAGLDDFRGLVDQSEIGAGLAPERHAFHAILDLLHGLSPAIDGALS